MTAYSPLTSRNPAAALKKRKKDGQRPWNVVCHNFSKQKHITVKKRSDIKWIKSGQQESIDPKIEIKIGWENTTNFSPLYFLLINMVSSHCALKMPFCCHLKRKSGVQHQKPPKDICERFARERNFAHSTSSKFQHLARPYLAP